MYNPKDHFTSIGMRNYIYQLLTLKKTLSFFIDNADELHYSESVLAAMYKLQNSLLELERGDGEKDDNG